MVHKDKAAFKFLYNNVIYAVFSNPSPVFLPPVGRPTDYCSDRCSKRVENWCRCGTSGRARWPPLAGFTRSTGTWKTARRNSASTGSSCLTTPGPHLDRGRDDPAVANFKACSPGLLGCIAFDTGGEFPGHTIRRQDDQLDGIPGARIPSRKALESTSITNF
jgi:hypothetical protein